MLPSYPLKYTWHHVIVGCIRFISSISLCPMFFLKIILWNVDQMMHPQYLAQFVLWTWPHSWDTLGENSPAAPAFVDLIKSLLHGKIMANSSVFLVEYPEINNKIINKIPIIFRISQHLPAFFIPNLHAAPRGAPPLGARRSALAEDALLWNLRAGGWPFSLVVQVPEEPGGICFHCRNR